MAITGRPVKVEPPHDPETGEIKLDNIQLENKSSQAPTGTSSQAGLRRLEKAAASGDGNAVDVLRRVLDPNDPMTVNLLVSRVPRHEISLGTLTIPNERVPFGTATWNDGSKNTHKTQVSLGGTMERLIVERP